MAFDDRTTNKTVTILSGQTDSESVVLDGSRREFGVFSPATLPETVTVETEPTRVGTAFVTLYSGPDTVTVPASACVVVMKGPFVQIRLHAATAVAADRVFTISNP